MDGREPVGKQPGASGHAAVPHTADMQVEAWSPTAERCIGEAVRAMVEGFADTSGATVVGDRAYAVTAESEEDLLVSVLEEIVYRMDADGEIPLDVEVGSIRPAGAAWACRSASGWPTRAPPCRSVRYRRPFRCTTCTCVAAPAAGPAG